MEKRKGGMHVAGPHRCLGKVMQLCFTGRTKTAYRQSLFKMPGGYVRKVPNMELPVVLPLWSHGQH